MSSIQPPPSQQTGAVYEYMAKTLGGPTLESLNVFSVGTSAKQLLLPNADRVGFIILNLGNGAIFVSFDGSVSSAKGLQLVAGGGSLSVVLPFDFTLCSHEWWGISDVNGPYNVTVIEYARYYKLKT